MQKLVRYFLLNEKKIAQKVWSKDLVYKKPFGRLSSHTPEQFNVMSRLMNKCIHLKIWI